MPLLTLHLTTTPTAEQATMIAKCLTDLTATYLGKDPRLTAVQILPVSSDFWFVGNKDVATQPAESFSLRIAVTAGTNTKSHYARYIEEVFEQMGTMIGPLLEESYIIIDEVPASAWGYGGKTQEERFVRGRMRASS